MIYKNFSYKKGNAFIDHMKNNSVLYTLELCRDNNIFFEDETEKIEEMLEMPREDIIVLIPGKNISSVALGKISEVFTSKESVLIRPIGLFYGMRVDIEEITTKSLWMKMPNFLFDTALFISWQSLTRVMRKTGINDLSFYLP